MFQQWQAPNNALRGKNSTITQITIRGGKKIKYCPLREVIPSVTKRSHTQKKNEIRKLKTFAIKQRRFSPRGIPCLEMRPRRSTLPRWGWRLTCKRSNIATTACLLVSSPRHDRVSPRPRPSWSSPWVSLLLLLSWNCSQPSFTTYTALIRNPLDPGEQPGIGYLRGTATENSRQQKERDQRVNAHEKRAVVSLVAGGVERGGHVAKRHEEN